MCLSLNRCWTLVICIAFSCSPNLMAQSWKNTPFDPGTWNPRDWTRGPNLTPPPHGEKLTVQNTGTEKIYFMPRRITIFIIP